MNIYKALLLVTLISVCGSSQPDDFDLIMRTMNRDEIISYADKNYNAGNNSAALRLYSEFIKKYPRDEKRQDALFKMAFLYYVNKDYKAAANAFAEFIGIDPAHPLAEQANKYYCNCQDKVQKENQINSQKQQSFVSESAATDAKGRPHSWAWL